MRTKVILIGLDGADPEFINRHLKALPNLAQLMQAGASGRLRSTIPPVTSPAWATAMSGMNPGKTGTSGFVRSDFATATQELIDSRLVAVPRIWNVLSHLNMRVAVIGVPLTYPIEEINGVMVSGFLAHSEESTFTFPPELGKELAVRGYKLHVSQGHYEYKEKKRFLEDLYRNGSLKFELVVELLEQAYWDCFIFVLSETDWIQHLFDREPGDPERSANQLIILEYFQFVDEFLGRLMQAAGKDVYMVVMSDHGFGRFLKANVHLNTWLLQRGYLSLKNNSGAIARHWIGSRIRDFALLPGFRHYKKRMSPRMKAIGLRFTKVVSTDIGWERTRAHFYNVFASTGCVQVNRQAFKLEEDYEAFRRGLLNEMRSLKNPKGGSTLIEELYLREELYEGPYVSQEPDIIFLFAEGYGGQDTVANSVVVDIPRGGAPGPGHRLQGMYVLNGPGIKAGERLDAGIQDIAPTVYHILDVAVPTETDGKVLSQAFLADSRLNREPRWTDYDIQRRFVAEALTSGEQEQVLDRLRALGYIE